MKRAIRRGHGFSQILIAIALTALAGLFILLLMSRRHKHPPDMKQRAQLRSVDTAIELHNSEFDRYPPSGAMDEAGEAYCGAMKLCEAVMGRDLLGFHPNSTFKSNGIDADGKVLYPDANFPSAEEYKANLSKRKGPYLPLDNATACRLADLYGEGNTGSFDPDCFVLCDVWRHVTHQSLGKRVGMPILYYKADTSKTAHDIDDPNNPENIYDYKDNHALLALGFPGKPGEKHPMYEDPKIFYEITKNEKVTTDSRPYRADTYILLSAGWDGLYGTEDDVANFDFKWKRK